MRKFQGMVSTYLCPALRVENHISQFCEFLETWPLGIFELHADFNFWVILTEIFDKPRRGLCDYAL